VKEDLFEGTRTRERTVEEKSLRNGIRR